MPRLLINLLCLLLLIFSSRCRTYKDVSSQKLNKKIILLKKGDQDQIKQLQQVVNLADSIIIKLDNNTKYFFGNISLINKKYVLIDGDGSEIYAPDSKEVVSLLTVIDAMELVLKNITFSGNDVKSKVQDYLVKVHTPSDKTKKIVLNNVHFKDSNKGGIMIQNIYPHYPYKNWTAGADTILIENSSVSNIGLASGIQIRGSHKYVEIMNCSGSDKDKTMHPTSGAMFGISAEVNEKSDEVGQVIIKNCIVKDANKAFFAQKVKHITFKNIRVDSLGHNPNYYKNGQPIGVVALKIDDLGYGNKAIVDSFYVTNTAPLPYRIFMALEESDKIGHTSNVLVNYFESDVGIRLGASGNNIVNSGILSGGSIDFLSENNVVSNLRVFREQPSNGVKILASNNYLKDCIFKNSNIVVYKNTVGNHISNCHLVKAEGMNAFIGLDLNNPDNPNEILIENCSVPDGILGLWSGGVENQSKNLNVTIRNSKNFKVHKYIKKKAKLKIE